MYIEASSPRQMNDTASLVSPLIRSTKTCTMRFFYNMFGEHIGILNVYRKVGNVKSLLWTISGDNGRNWLKKEIDLSASSSGFYVRFSSILLCVLCRTSLYSCISSKLIIVVPEDLMKIISDCFNVHLLQED